MRPRTRYTKSGDVSIAYQVVGEGGLDLIYVPGWVSHIELAWEEPSLARMLERLASFSRLILFDKRGTGLSDRVPESKLPTLEQRMDDVRAVMEAAGSETAAIFGWSEGGNMCMLFAATYPERTTALITCSAFAKRLRAPDYPWAPSLGERRALFDRIERDWGGPVALPKIAPSAVGDRPFEEWWAAYLRAGASPGAAVALTRMNTEIDVRQVLPAITVPTLVLHRTGDLDADVEEGRYLAERIPGAKLVELPGRDHLPFVGDVGAVVDEIEEFLTGARGPVEAERLLTTVMFIDLVGSTERAAKLGDRRWSEVLESYRALVRAELARFRGCEVETAGDGFLATFDGPARAISCACAVTRGLHSLEIDARAGLHTGECEVVGEKLAGIAVHTGARVAELAAPGEVLVSSTVKDLVAGSGIHFADRGRRVLKGVPGRWRLFAVEK